MNQKKGEDSRENKQTKKAFIYPKSASSEGKRVMVKGMPFRKIPADLGA